MYTVMVEGFCRQGLWVMQKKNVNFVQRWKKKLTWFNYNTGIPINPINRFVTQHCEMY